MSASHLVSPAGTTAAGDTWNVSGPDFLGFYFTFGVAVVLFAAVAFSRLDRPVGSRGIAPDDLSPIQLALLTGGRRHAVAVALAELYSLARLDVTGAVIAPATRPGSAPVLTKPEPGLDSVTRAVLDALSTADTGGRPSASGLTEVVAVASVLDEEERRLRAAGLLPGIVRRTGTTVAVASALALVTLGVARIVAGTANDKPVVDLVFLTFFGAWVLVWVIRRARAARLTPRGAQAVRRLRGSNLHLSPVNDPSWTTYGARSMVLATALFGASVMVAADPAFAGGLGISEPVSRWSGWSGWSDVIELGGNRFFGGGSGCGSGSGCGGASSCGGGGGGGCGGGGGGGCGGGGGGGCGG